jgi:dephospho-CoA kinase
VAHGLRIGLTGGIGSGKSTVAQMLVQLGAHLVDTDAIARALTADGGPALAALRQSFGHEIFDAQGRLRRDVLRQKVFGNERERRRLEAVLHPMISEQAKAQAQAAPGTAMIVFDVPLLAESSHWRGRVQRVLVVDCHEATQVQRVSARPGWSAEMAGRVISSQASRAQRRSVADAVLFNDGIELEHLRSQVQSLWRIWLEPV